MWKTLKFFGSLLKTVFGLLVVLFIAGLILLYVLERDVPAPLVRKIASALSTDDLLVRIDRVTFSLKNGLKLHRLKAMPKRMTDSALVSADELAIDFSLMPRLALNERIRGVTVRNLSVPALPPSLRHSGDKPSVHKPFSGLPDLAPISILIENADVFGIRARRISTILDLNSNGVKLSDIDIAWPDKTFDMQVTGGAELDLTKRMAAGHIRGQAFPENILPLFHILHARGAVEQINCFSNIARPIDADYTFDVNIDNTDFAMTLDLNVGPCSYRNVPMAFAKGTLGIYGTNIYTTVAVKPLDARSAAGAPLSGSLIYREETESLDLDASTTMDLVPLFDIIHILNHGELSRIHAAAPPSAEVRGVVALSSRESTVSNQLAGKIAFPEGTILNFQVKDMTGDFSLNGYTARFDHVRGSSPSGGKLAGSVVFSFPEYAATATVFNSDVTVSDVALEELSRAFNVTNARAGFVSGTFHIGGSAYKDTIATLSGKGSATVRNGVINRMQLFAGFTDYLSRTIPGISSLVNQSSASMDFTLRDGVLTTDNLLIEGDIFSIKGRGTYNLATDKLDFVVRASIFKQKTLAGKLTHFFTLPFSRLLLEFKVFGSLDKPDWSYVNILEKITEGVSDLSTSAGKTTP